MAQLSRRSVLAGSALTAALARPAIATAAAPLKVGMMLLDGELHFRRYRELDNRELLDTVAKVKPILVPGRSNICWTRLEVELLDGRVIEREAEEHAFAPISPYQRLSQAADGILSRVQTERFFELLMTLERQPTLAALMACLRVP